MHTMKKNKKIAMLLLVYNNEKYIQHLHFLFQEIEKTCDYEFSFFIYENNSTDGTKEAIHAFMQHRKGRFVCENVTNPNFFEGGIEIQRASHMAMLRQKLKQQHGKKAIEDSDYVFILDSDVIFDLETLEHMIRTFHSVSDCVMTSGYSICYDTFQNSSKKAQHYYDSLAFISNDGISYKENDNTCLFDSCNRCLTHRKVFNIKIPNEKLISSTLPFEVKSAFGSLSLVDPKTYNKINYSLEDDHDYHCEHHAFAEKMRKYGNIIVDPRIKLFTTIPSLRLFDQIYEDLKELRTEQK